MAKVNTMTLRWFIVAVSPRAYIFSHPSTRSHSSVASTRLLPCCRKKRNKSFKTLHTATDNSDKTRSSRIYWKIQFIHVTLLAQNNRTWPICFIKSVITGRVPIPVDQTAIPYGREETSPLFSLVEISLSVTFTTIDPVFRLMPSLWNLSSAKSVILLSNLWEEKKPLRMKKHQRKVIEFLITEM